MITNGIHGSVSSKALKRLKTIVDTQTIEKLTVYTIREYDETIDSIMRNRAKESLNDENRPFFTDKNGRAMQAVKNMQKSELEPER